MVGKIIKIGSTDLLVLDEIDGNPFVVAMNLDIHTEFDSKSNNYDGSVIEEKINNWLTEVNIPVIERELDLTTLDGCKNYKKKIVKAAPLTLDEYRKYSEIILPHIKDWFWLATAWSAPSRDYYNSNYVGIVDGGGGMNYGNYGYANGSLAPAFIIDKDKLKLSNKENLKDIPTEVLVAELNRRFINR